MFIDDTEFARIKKLARKTVRQAYSVNAKERSRAAITADDLLVLLARIEDDFRYHRKTREVKKLLINPFLDMH